MKDKDQPRTYYYEVGVDESDPLAIICVEKDDQGVDVYQFNKGKWIEDWPEDVTFYVEGSHPEDYLVGGLQWKIVSERVRQVVKEWCDADEVQFLPVKVLHKETMEEIRLYWALNVVKVIEALDWERTRWLHPEKKEEDEHPILDIVKPALRWEFLEGVDLFRLKVKDDIGSLFISPRLEQYLERAGATRGIKFFPVPVY